MESFEKAKAECAIDALRQLQESGALVHYVGQSDEILSAKDNATDVFETYIA